MSGSKHRDEAGKKDWARRVAQDVVDALTRNGDEVAVGERRIERLYDEVARAISGLREDEHLWMVTDTPSPLFLDLDTGTYLVERGGEGEGIRVRQVGWAIDAEHATEDSEEEAIARSISAEAQRVFRYLKSHSGGEAPKTVTWWLEEGSLTNIELEAQYLRITEQPRVAFRSQRFILYQEEHIADQFQAIREVTEVFDRARRDQDDWFDWITYWKLEDAVEELGQAAHRLLESMKEWGLFATDMSRMMEGLAARTRNAEDDYADQMYTRRMRQVYAAFKPYAEGQPLPPGTTTQLMRFLVVSAGLPGLWQRMDEDNPRLADSLLGYYGAGLSTVELAESLPGVTNPGSVGQFLERGLRWLWTHLPEESSAFPIDKQDAFPLGELQATRKERRRAASKEWARKHRFHERGREFALRRWGEKAD